MNLSRKPKTRFHLISTGVKTTDVRWWKIAVTVHKCWRFIVCPGFYEFDCGETVKWSLVLCFSDWGWSFLVKGLEDHTPGLQPAVFGLGHGHRHTYSTVCRHAQGIRTTAKRLYEPWQPLRLIAQVNNWMILLQDVQWSIVYMCLRYCLECQSKAQSLTFTFMGE